MTSLSHISQRKRGETLQTLIYSKKHHPSPAKKYRSRRIYLSDLPQDLVRIILEQAAMMCPKTAIALILVSRQVHAWVEHILYHTVVLRTSHSIDLFRVPFNSKPRSFFAQHVQNLFINGKYGMDIILACTNVKRLAAYPLSLIPLPDLGITSPIDNPLFDYASQYDAEFRHCPVEIMLLGYLEDVSWSSPLFHHVRFLYFGIDRPTAETAAAVALLPCLTYCAFPYDGDERLDDLLISTVSILLQSRSLAYLIIHINDEQEGCDRTKKNSIWKQLSCISDRRLLVGTESCFDGSDWLETVNHNVDLWGTWILEYKNWRNFAA